MDVNSVRIAVVVDRVRLSAQCEGTVISGWDAEFLRGKLTKCGIPHDWVTYAVAGPDLETRLNSFPNLTVIVPTENESLRLTTGHKSISKWHLSPLDSISSFRARKVIPTWHPDAVRKDFSLGLYVERALLRIRKECETQNYLRKEKRFSFNPNLEDTHAILNSLLKLTAADYLSVDIETGRGQINTVGFAWSPSDAVAIGTLPDRCGDEEFYKLWAGIGAVLLGPSRKVFQNGIYEVLYFARYGCAVRNFAHDTMLAQKLLWPEFEKGLDNVGRFYTNEPYWKDSGRIESEEGKRKDWGAVRDWTAHFNYNCLDTSGTLEAALNQRQDLETRGILKFYDEQVIPVARLTQEMCLRGLPVSAEVRSALIAEYETKCADLAAGLSAPPARKKDQVSYVTRAQKIELLEAKGYRIPLVRNKQTGKSGKSVDEKSLKKLRVKYPNDPDIPKFLLLAEYEKALSSYFRAELDPLDGFVRFALDPLSTETMRMSSSLDPWSRGFNAQTMPKYVKSMIRWSE